MSNRTLFIVAAVAVVVAVLCIGMMIGQSRATKLEAKPEVTKDQIELSKVKASKAEIVEVPEGVEPKDIEEPSMTLIPEDLRKLLLTGIGHWKGMCNEADVGGLKMELALAKMGVSRLGDGTAAKAVNGVIDFVLADLNKGEFQRVKLVLSTFELILSDEATELVEKSYADLPAEVKLLLKRFMK